MLSLAAALALASVPFAVSAAQPQPPVAVSPAPVLQLRFAPPLDKPLRFRLTTNKASDDMALTQELTFRREGAGYVMAVRWLTIAVEGQSFDITAKDTPLPPTMKLLFAPLEVELNASGQMVRVRNWADYVQHMRDVASDLGKAMYQSSANRQDFANFFAKFVSQYEKVSAEDAPDLVLTGWPRIFALMGISGQAGAAVRSEVMVQTAFLSTRVPYNFSTVLSLSADGQLLHVSAKGAPSEAIHEQLIDGLVAMVIASLPPGDDKADPKALRHLFGDLELGNTIEASFDRTTGLPVKAQIGDILYMNHRDKSDTLVIEAL